MVKRPAPPQPTPAIIAHAALPLAIQKLERRLKDLTEFESEEISGSFYTAAETIANRVNATLLDVFGLNTIEYKRAALHPTNFTYNVISRYGKPRHEEVKAFSVGRGRAIASLENEIAILRERLEDGAAEPTGVSQRGQPAATLNKDVFIVHGRDTPAKTEVARFVERAGLNAIILHEQPNAGKTVIEKFEKYGSTSGFAIVVATPDDVGGLTADNLRPRARQNVIGEMFWFAGRLGRERVCVLVKDNDSIEMPTDFAGVVYTSMDDSGAWKMDLAKELNAAGYEIDWAKALS